VRSTFICSHFLFSKSIPLKLKIETGSSDNPISKTHICKSHTQDSCDNYCFFHLDKNRTFMTFNAGLEKTKRAKGEISRIG
jgi:hypothetical protein